MMPQSKNRTEMKWHRTMRRNLGCGREDRMTSCGSKCQKPVVDGQIMLDWMGVPCTHPTSNLQGVCSPTVFWSFFRSNPYLSSKLAPITNIT